MKIRKQISRLDISGMGEAIKSCPRQAEETIRHSIELAKDQLEPLKEDSRVLRDFAEMILRREK